MESSKDDDTNCLCKYIIMGCIPIGVISWFVYIIGGPFVTFVVVALVRTELVFATFIISFVFLLISTIIVVVWYWIYFISYILVIEFDGRIISIIFYLLFSQFIFLMAIIGLSHIIPINYSPLISLTYSIYIILVAAWIANIFYFCIYDKKSHVNKDYIKMFEIIFYAIIETKPNHHINDILHISKFVNNETKNYEYNDVNAPQIYQHPSFWVIFKNVFHGFLNIFGLISVYYAWIMLIIVYLHYLYATKLMTLYRYKNIIFITILVLYSLILIIMHLIYYQMYRTYKIVSYFDINKLNEHKYKQNHVKHNISSDIKYLLKIHNNFKSIHDCLKPIFGYDLSLIIMGYVSHK